MFISDLNSVLILLASVGIEFCFVLYYCIKSDDLCLMYLLALKKKYALDIREDHFTIVEFDLLLRGDFHDLHFTLKLQFQFLSTSHVGSEGGIDINRGDEQLDLQHSLLHGLQTER